MESFTINYVTGTVYYTTQRKNMSTRLYSIDRIGETDVTKEICTFQDTTIFGCCYDNGHIYLACFNKNKIIDYNLINGEIYEYNVPSPNDVCSYGNYLYVAAGTNVLGMNIPSLGRIVKIEKITGRKTTFLSGLTTLSGIRAHNNTLYVSRLYDFVSISLSDKKITVISECRDGDKNFLSDNITLTEDEKVYVSLYREIDNEEFLKMRNVGGFFYTIGTIITQFSNLFRGRGFDLTNPEQLLTFSLQDEMSYIKYLVYDIKTGKIEFKKIENPLSGDGHYTQFAEYRGELIGVNFKIPHLLWTLNGVRRIYN